MSSVVRGCVCLNAVRLASTIIFAHRRSILDGIELMIIIVATFGQALSGQAPAIRIIGVLVVWRFLVSRDIPLQSRGSPLTHRLDGFRYRW